MIKRYYVYEMNTNRNIIYTDTFEHALFMRNSFNNNSNGLRYSIRVKYMEA